MFQFITRITNHIAEKKAQERERKLEILKKDFYDYCRECGIESVSQRNRDKLGELAENKGIDRPYEELVSWFNEMDAKRKEFEREQAAKRYEKLAAEGRLLEKATQKYIPYKYGKKTEAVYSDLIENCRRQISSMDDEITAIKSGGEATWRAGVRKEHDWAVHGGIASAIAGTGAGVAMALNVQSKNAEIRSQNSAYTKLVAAYVVMQMDEVWARQASVKKRLKQYEEKRDRYKTLLVDSSIDANTLLQRLEIQITKTERTEYDAILMEIEARERRALDREDRLTIEGKSAEIDGHIKVVLLDGETELGEGVFTLRPEEYSTTYSTICMGPIPKDVQYRVEFRPVDLWLREY